VTQLLPTAHNLHRSGDYDLANPPEVRKYLGTYGLTPPAVEDYAVQAQRCEQTRLLELPRN
jgi:hypothetical protein